MIDPSLNCMWVKMPREKYAIIVIAQGILAAMRVVQHQADLVTFVDHFKGF